MYAAARAAVKAAANKSSENERLGEPERADKRRQALAWLRADLELVTKMLGDGQLLAQSIANWQTDSTLASVRDPEALAKLPATEREQWQQLWADVAAITNNPLVQARGNAARGGLVAVQPKITRSPWQVVRRTTATSGSSMPPCHC